MFPIIFPYKPSRAKYAFFDQQFLSKDGKGDFDTTAILSMRDPSGKIYRIDKYYKEDPDDGHWTAIDKKEYNTRYKYRANREEDQNEAGNS